MRSKGVLSKRKAEGLDDAEVDPECKKPTSKECMAVRDAQKDTQKSVVRANFLDYPIPDHKKDESYANMLGKYDTVLDAVEDDSDVSEYVNEVEYGISGRPNTQDENEWVIWTRDNNFPDTYGTHSTTSEQLPHTQVAKLFEKKFSRGISWQSMQKRYFKNIKKYYEDNPAYPQNIIYAPKAKAPKPKPTHKSLVKKAQKQTNEASAQASEISIARVVNASTTQAGSSSPATVRNSNLPPAKERRLRGGTYWPPRESVEAAGLNAYIDSTRQVPASAMHPVDIQIRVVDLEERALGTVTIPTNDLLASSGFYKKERETSLVSVIQIKTKSMRIVQRYVQCISPISLSKLPQYDFFVTGDCKADGHINFRGTCTLIHWDLEALFDLYLLATEFQDDCVRDLVLDLWYHQFRSGYVHELSSDFLDSLYQLAPNDSRARDFWAIACHGYGVSERICNPEIGEDWCSAIVDQLRNTIHDHADIHCIHLLLDKMEVFCSRFHRHSKNTPCSLERSQDFDVDLPPDYFAIAWRMLPQVIRYGPSSTEVAGEIAVDFRDQHMTLSHS